MYADFNGAIHFSLWPLLDLQNWPQSWKNSIFLHFKGSLGLNEGPFRKTTFTTEITMINCIGYTLWHFSIRRTPRGCALLALLVLLRILYSRQNLGQLTHYSVVFWHFDRKVHMYVWCKSICSLWICKL